MCVYCTGSRLHRHPYSVVGFTHLSIPTGETRREQRLQTIVLQDRTAHQEHHTIPGVSALKPMPLLPTIRIPAPRQVKDQLGKDHHMSMCLRLSRMSKAYVKVLHDTQHDHITTRTREQKGNMTYNIFQNNL